MSLAESADGAIWMGTATGSLARIDPKTLAGTQWKVPEVYRILSEGGPIWVATGAGLYLVDANAADRTPRLVEDKAIADPRKRFTDLSLDNQNRIRASSAWTERSGTTSTQDSPMSIRFMWQRTATETSGQPVHLRA
jgi:ligand-binding sensor domain-containing protein